VTARRGRKPGFQMPERHRSKIADSQILNRLIAFCSGDDSVKLSPAQVTASLGLLKKVMPDLASVENTSETQKTYVIRAPEPVALASDWERQNAPAPRSSKDRQTH
jgi:hypothetical protein